MKQSERVIRRERWTWIAVMSMIDAVPTVTSMS